MRKDIAWATASELSTLIRARGFSSAERRLIIGQMLITGFIWNDAPGGSDVYRAAYGHLIGDETEAELRDRQGDDRDEDPHEPAVEAAQ